MINRGDTFVNDVNPCWIYCTGQEYCEYLHDWEVNPVMMQEYDEVDCVNELAEVEYQSNKEVNTYWAEVN